jgi:hypothetical protein
VSGQDCATNIRLFSAFDEESSHESPPGDLGTDTELESISVTEQLQNQEFLENIRFYFEHNVK